MHPDNADVAMRAEVGTTEYANSEVRDASVRVHLTDIQRSLLRWPATPYAALVRQPHFGAAIRAAVSESPPGLLQDLRHFENAVFSMAAPPEEHISRTTARRPYRGSASAREAATWGIWRTSPARCRSATNRCVS